MTDSGRAARRPPAEPIVLVSSPVDGVVQVGVRGTVNGSALALCRRMIDDALALEPTQVVLDLGCARCDATTVPLLSLMRRYLARRGVRIGLSPASRGALALLRREHLSDLFPVVSVPLRRLDDAARAAS
jgi:hypothetical protein